MLRVSGGRFSWLALAALSISIFTGSLAIDGPEQLDEQQAELEGLEPTEFPRSMEYIWVNLYKKYRIKMPQGEIPPVFGWPPAKDDPAIYVDLDNADRDYVKGGDYESRAEIEAMIRQPHYPGYKNRLLKAWDFANARAKLNSYLDEYRKFYHDMGGLTFRPTMNLGALSKLSEPLGENINNYAPDSYLDFEVMRLFGLRDKVRQIQEAIRTGSETRALNVNKLRQFNADLLINYIFAIQNAPSIAGEHKPTTAAAQKEADLECGGCGDSLLDPSEPLIELKCGHALHDDCASGWCRDSARKDRDGANTNACPNCGAPFRFLPITLKCLDELLE